LQREGDVPTEQEDNSAQFPSSPEHKNTIKYDSGTGLLGLDLNTKNFRIDISLDVKGRSSLVKGIIGGALAVALAGHGAAVGTTPQRPNLSAPPAVVQQTEDPPSGIPKLFGPYSGEPPISPDESEQNVIMLQTDHDEIARGFAAGNLRYFFDPVSISALSSHGAGDPSAHVRAMSAVALGSLVSNYAMYTQCFQTKGDASVEADSVGGISDAYYVQALTALQSLANDQDEEVRRAAALFPPSTPPIP
jgi:hypothetical protein